MLACASRLQDYKDEAVFMTNESSPPDLSQAHRGGWLQTRSITGPGRWTHGAGRKVCPSRFSAIPQV